MTTAMLLVMGLCVASVDNAEAEQPAVEECLTPEQSARPAITQAEFDKLIVWIALKTDYDLGSVYRNPPEIVFCQVGDIVDYEDDGLWVEEFLAAAYDVSRRRIYLVQPWTAEDPFDLSVLLHELIHAVQLANRDWPCIGAPELEAYMLQSRWLLEQGVTAPFDWATIFKLSQCPSGPDALPP